MVLKILQRMMTWSYHMQYPLNRPFPWSLPKEQHESYMSVRHVIKWAGQGMYLELWKWWYLLRAGLHSSASGNHIEGRVRRRYNSEKCSSSVLFVYICGHFHLYFQNGGRLAIVILWQWCSLFKWQARWNSSYDQMTKGLNGNGCCW